MSIINNFNKKPDCSIVNGLPVPKLYEKENFGSFPFLLYQPFGLHGKYKKALAPYCSLTVFNNIRLGHARILTYDLKEKSALSLKCHFHSNDAKFTYRSDKYPGDLKKQWESMMKLAEKNSKLTFSMQLYDNRRTSPDDLLINWKGQEIVFQHAELPFTEKPFSPAEIDNAIRFYNYIKHKTYETIPQQVQI